MLIIIGLMVSGIIVGRWLKQENENFIQKGIFLTILILLFLLGISVGYNRQIMEQLGTIGVEAMMITFGAVAGSVVCTWLVYKFYFSKGL